MPRTPVEAPRINAQYNIAAADSLPVRIAASARRRMFDAYCEVFPPRPADTVLDVGVTSDQTYASSNYFEAWYPHKDRVTAAGLDDASFLETTYPGMRFVRANALELPFDDRSFDIVHSSAVIEHVGSRDNQLRMVRELSRVARRGVFFTTPNRWFPVEFHTVVPFIHWLPKPWFRRLVRPLRGEFFALEENLNLMTPGEVRRLCATQAPLGYEYAVCFNRTFGYPSNILAILKRDA